MGDEDRSWQLPGRLAITSYSALHHFTTLAHTTVKEVKWGYGLWCGEVRFYSAFSSRESMNFVPADWHPCFVLCNVQETLVRGSTFYFTTSMPRSFLQLILLSNYPYEATSRYHVRYPRRSFEVSHGTDHFICMTFGFNLHSYCYKFWLLTIICDFLSSSTTTPFMTLCFMSSKVTYHIFGIRTFVP